MVLRQSWDSEADGADFAAAYPAYAAGVLGSPAAIANGSGQCWSGGDVICLYHSRQQTMIVRAPTVEIATAVAAAHPFP
jgi:hypothetical protein